MGSRRQRLLILGIALLTIGCDRATKRIAEAVLSGAPQHSYLGDTVRLEYVRNDGGFLGLGSQLPRYLRTLVFELGTGLLVTAMLLFSVRPQPLLSAMALTLISAGGLSNLADRLLAGSVVDFLNVGMGGLRTGIFNTADLAITTGVVVVMCCRIGK